MAYPHKGIHRNFVRDRVWKLLASSHLPEMVLGIGVYAATGVTGTVSRDETQSEIDESVVGSC